MGEFNDKKVILVVEDSKSSAKDSVTAVSKLVNSDNVQAVMITWLDSYQGAESVVPNDMLLISQDAAIESVNVPVNHSNVFSLWYRTKSKSEVILSEMARQNVKSIYILTQNDSYYATLRKFLIEEAREKGINVIAAEAVQLGDDVRSTITKIMSSKADAVFFGSYDEGLNIDFLKRYQELIGKKIPLYGDEFMEQNFHNKNVSPAWLEGVTFYVPAESNRTFEQKYMAQYGEKVALSAATTYDTVKIIAQYLKDNPSDVSKYMRSTTFNTMTYGDITFDAIGGVISNQKAISVKKVIGEKIVPLISN